MTPVIILMIVAAIVAIGAYQLVINKYYWGPKGRPSDSSKKARDLSKDSIK